MLTCLSIQFMASVVINSKKRQSLFMHIIKRTGKLFQQIEKCRHSITITGRSCCLFLFVSIALQNG